MAVAYFMAHAPRGFFPLLNGGELAISDLPQRRLRMVADPRRGATSAR
jgi:hypothetical protein